VIRHSLAGVLAWSLLVTSAGAAFGQPTPDTGPDAAEADVMPLDEVVPVASDTAGELDPLVWADAHKERYVDHPPETTPPASSDLPALEPDVVAIKAWLFKTLGVVAPEVRLRPVVLDFDPEDEVLVEVPFALDGRTVEWLLLLDKRGAGYVLAKRWTVDGRDARAKVVAHGHGQRACLIVESQDADWHEVELLQLDGALRTLGAFGAGGAAHLTVDRQRATYVIALALADGVHRAWSLSMTKTGFELKAADVASSQP